MTITSDRPEPFVERRAPRSTSSAPGRRRSRRGAPRRPAPLWQRLLSGALWTVIVVGTLGYAASLAVPLWFQAHDEKLLVVTSGSMAPTFDAGDAVVMHAVHDASDLKEGQVVSFWPVGSSQLVTHRIVRLVTLPVMRVDATGKGIATTDPATGDARTNPYIITKGDANPTSDPDATPVTRVRGVVLEVHHGWGFVLDWAGSPLGRAVLLVPPLVALAVLELVAFQTGRRPRRRPPLRDAEDRSIDAFLLG
jgi:signal peptidase I